jgi:hypothetical protein
MPEWYLIIFGLVGLSLLGLLWRPLLWSAPLAVAAFAMLLAQAVYNGIDSSFADEPLTPFGRGMRHAVTSLLYLLQPAARLAGRLRHGLSPWRRLGQPSYALPRRRIHHLWSERWQPLERRLETLKASLRQLGAVVRTGGDFDGWDIDVRGGLTGSIRVRATVEEHGEGRQFIRIRSWPRVAPSAIAVALAFTLLAVWAAWDGCWTATALLGAASLTTIALCCTDCATATASYLHALKAPGLGGRMLGAAGAASTTSGPEMDEREAHVSGQPRSETLEVSE